MIKIDGINIDNDIFKAKFACDIDKCKGACCTFLGDFGAPVLEDEVFLISDSLSEVRKYLSERSLETIKADGFVEGAPGSYTTVCIDKKDCVFVVYDGDVAKCAIEKAFFDGKIKFRKPVSCHLFPLRVGGFDELRMYYEKIPECKSGVIKGKSNDISLLDNLKEAIERQFGKEFFNKLAEKTKKEL